MKDLISVMVYYGTRPPEIRATCAALYRQNRTIANIKIDVNYNNCSNIDI